MPSGRFSGTYAAPAISASVMPLSGEPLTEYLPSCELDVLRRRLEQVRRDPLGLVGHLDRRLGERLAADGQRARAVGAQAERAGAGVAVDRRRPDVGRGADAVGDDLRERRVEPLAVRRGAGVGGDRAGRVHAHDRRTRRSRPAGRRRSGRRRATAPGRRSPCRSRSRCRGRCPALAQLGLLAPERVDVDVREQLVERAVVVAGVVDEAERDLGREVLLRDEVLAPQLERVHARARPRAARSSPRSGASPPGRPAPRMASVAILLVKTPTAVKLEVRDLVAAADHEAREARDERRQQRVVGAEVGDRRAPRGR